MCQLRCGRPSLGRTDRPGVPSARRRAVARQVEAGGLRRPSSTTPGDAIRGDLLPGVSVRRPPSPRRSRRHRRCRAAVTLVVRFGACGRPNCWGPIRSAESDGNVPFATSAVGAVLEGLQAYLTSLPVEELRSRRLARVNAPDSAPIAARLTSRRLAGAHGVTAALWPGADRPLTQRWAAAFRRDGWWALYGGLQHDPSGRLRSYAVFDHSGDHSPTAGGAWTHELTTPADDVALHQELVTFGITVRAAGDLRSPHRPNDPPPESLFVSGCATQDVAHPDTN